MTERERIIEAYIRMAREATYRPAAPGDGFGSVDLSPAQLRSKNILRAEAERYADKFIGEENACEFWIGISNFASNRALVYTVEAARLMCGAQEVLALQLLKMAVDELSPRPLMTQPISASQP
jgi:hypothetical protein